MSKQTNKIQVEYFVKINKPELEKNFAIIQEINGGSYRIVIRGKKIDYFPSSSKYHNHTNDTRGTCINWWEDILKLF